jgi:hypothetical protein
LGNWLRCGRGPCLCPQVFEAIAKIGVLPPLHGALFSLLDLEINDFFLEVVQAQLQLIGACRVSLAERRQIPFDQVRGIAEALDFGGIIRRASLTSQRHRQSDHENTSTEHAAHETSPVCAATTASALPAHRHSQMVQLT